MTLTRTLLLLVLGWKLKTILQFTTQVLGGENGFTRAILVLFIGQFLFFLAHLFGLKRLVNPALLVTIGGIGLIDYIKWSTKHDVG